MPASGSRPIPLRTVPIGNELGHFMVAGDVPGTQSLECYYIAKRIRDSSRIGREAGTQQVYGAGRV